MVKLCYKYEYEGKKGSFRVKLDQFYIILDPSSSPSMPADLYLLLAKIREMLPYLDTTQRWDVYTPASVTFQDSHTFMTISDPSGAEAGTVLVAHGEHMHIISMRIPIDAIEMVADRLPPFGARCRFIPVAMDIK